MYTMSEVGGPELENSMKSKGITDVMKAILGNLYILHYEALII